MKLVINLMRHFWKTEVAGYCLPASYTSSSYRDAQSLGKWRPMDETWAAGHCYHHTAAVPSHTAVWQCSWSPVTWTANGTVPYPPYPCQLPSSEGWSVLSFCRGDVLQRYPCHIETWFFCCYSCLALFPVLWLIIRKQKFEEKSEKRKLTVFPVWEEVSCTHTSWSLITCSLLIRKTHP